MKLDYQTSYRRIKLRFSRRTIHIVLGCVAMVCVILAMSPARKPSSTNAERISLTANIPAIALAEDSPWPELGAELDSDTESESETNASEASANDEAKAGESLSEAQSNANTAQANKATKATLIAKDTSAEASKDTKDTSLKASADNKSSETTEKNVVKTEKLTDLKTVLKEDVWHTVKIRPRDTLAKIFARQGYSKKDLHAIMKTDSDNEVLAALQPGQTLKLKVSATKQINGLTLDIAPGDTLTVSRDATGFHANHKQLPLEKQLAFGKGKIQNSLSISAKKAGLDHKVVAQMVEIFGWNIDFASIRPNDTFRVLFEEKYLEGEKIDSGHILAAEIITNGKKHQAIRYTDHSGKTGYFAPDGGGMHQAFLRYPVTFTRISSSFGNRFHPILHKMRQHKGVDYSAPHGTPVQTTGDGKVIFAGNRRGYGKVIEIQHGAQYSTLYAHLSRFAKNLRQGTNVKQGQVIGYVGATGLATGPHLHYEFRVAGIHRDPTTVSLPRKNPIPDKQKPHFMAHAKEMLRLMDVHESKVEMALNEFPRNE